MKKIIVLIIVLFVVTGCHANVNFSISESGKVTERIEIKDSKMNHSSVMNYDEYINDIILDNVKLSQIEDYEKYNINDSENFGINLTKEHNSSVCNSLEYSSLKEIMIDFKCVEKNNIYTITGTPIYFICDNDCFMKPDVSSATININLPKKAISSNADSENDNIYTWNFSGQADEKLELKFSFVTEEEQKKVVQAQEKSKKDTIIIIAASVILLIGLIVIIIKLSKKYKENRLKY